ncbi:MAG: IS1595 family transposase [Actinobacteria bacterium]|nr:IS1595 family transposase [Actinomycetota bacterium]
MQDEHDAYLLLEELRWKGPPVCPHCGHDKAYFLTPKGGSRGTGMKKADGERTRSVRRVWKCAKCRKQFSVLTGTIFHGTKVSLRTWLMVMVQMSSAKNGISAREVERMHGVTPETAWFMLHRLRESMKRDPLAGLLAGTIVADETYIGGKPKNRHQQGRVRPGTSKGYAGTPKDKTPVLSLIDKATGEVRSRVVPNVTGETLGPAIRAQVDIANSRLHTDGWHGYRKLGREFESHEWVDHAAPAYEFVRGDVHTNQAGRSTGPTTTSARSTFTATWPSSTTATRLAS